MSLPNGPEIVAAFLGVVAAGAGGRAAQPGLHGATSSTPTSTTCARARCSSCAARRARRARPAPRSASAQLELAGARTAELALADLAARLPRRRAIPRPSRCCCTRAARRASPRACRSASATWPPPRARSPPPTGSAGDDASHCVMPLFHVHGLVASTLATLASGGTRDRAAPLLGERVLGRLRDARRDLVLGRADDPPHPALARRGRRADHAGHGLRFARSCSSALPGPLMDGVRGSASGCRSSRPTA